MWSVTLPFQPVSAPRPSARRNVADATNDVAEKRISTYYDKKYLDYLKKIKSFIEDQGLLDDEFYSIRWVQLWKWTFTIRYQKAIKKSITL